MTDGFIPSVFIFLVPAPDTGEATTLRVVRRSRIPPGIRERRL